MQATIQAPARRRKWTPEDQLVAEALRSQGLSYERIGAELGCGKGVVRVHLDPEAAEQRRTEARERARAKYATAEGLAKQREAQYRHRAIYGRPSRSQHGLPHRYEEDKLGRMIGTGLHAEVARLYREGWEPDSIRSWLDSREKRQTAIKKAGQWSLSVLLFDPRRFPEPVKFGCNDPEVLRAKSLRRYHIRASTDPAFVLAMRERGHIRRQRHRKGIIFDKVGGKEIHERFKLFDHQCAYCGATTELQVEHVIPLSRGGLHTIDNIVPACRECNYSKNTHPVEQWYRSQPFFTERRWARLRRVLKCAKRNPLEQLGLPGVGPTV